MNEFDANVWSIECYFLQNEIDTSCKNHIDGGADEARKIGSGDGQLQLRNSRGIDMKKLSVAGCING